MTAMLPTLGKGEHEPGDTASNALAPAWPSMCARQTQIMTPVDSATRGSHCYLAVSAEAALVCPLPVLRSN